MEPPDWRPEASVIASSRLAQNSKIVVIKILNLLATC